MFAKMLRAAAAGGGGFAFACGLRVLSADSVQAEEAQREKRQVWPPAVGADLVPKRPKLTGADVPGVFMECNPSNGAVTGGISSSWKYFRLEERLPINHDSAKFVFSFNDPETEFSLPACSTMQFGLRLKGSNKPATRLYTPITPNGSKGGFEVVVKLYQNGAFTPSLFALQPGDGVYARMQHLKLKYTPGTYNYLGCICAGTGIAPMMQLIRAVLDNPDDKTKVGLLFSNSRHRDILCKDELDELQRKHPGRFRVTYSLQQPPVDWKGEVGYVTHAMVARTMPRPGSGCLIACSGPDKLMMEVAGLAPANTLAWRSKTETAIPETMALQPATPYVQQGLHMGILYECGFKGEEVYRF